MYIILVIFMVLTFSVESFAYSDFGCFTIRDGKRCESVTLSGEAEEEILNKAEIFFKRHDFPYDGVWCASQTSYIQRVKNPKGNYTHGTENEEIKVVSSGTKGFQYAIKETTAAKMCGVSGVTHKVPIIVVYRNGEEFAVIKKPPSVWYPNALGKVHKAGWRGDVCLKSEDPNLDNWQMDCAKKGVYTFAPSYEEAFVLAKKMCSN